MKNFNIVNRLSIALLASLCLCLFSISCDKIEVVLEKRPFVFSSVTPSIAETGIPCDKGSAYRFTVTMEYDWGIVDPSTGTLFNNPSGSTFYTVVYDGYSAVRNGSEIIVTVAAFEDGEHYRRVAVDFATVAGDVTASWVNYQYGTGAGTEEIPYYISSADQLSALATRVNSSTSKDLDYYYLICDIYLQGSNTNPWTPIGNLSHPFYGHFDGGGHLISGLYIDVHNLGYQGLFGHLGEDSYIKNLGVSGQVMVTSQLAVDDTDGLTPVASLGSLSRADFSVGDADVDLDIEQDDDMESLSAKYNIGGLVGLNNGGTIDQCYNLCTVLCIGDASEDFGENVGGIVGCNLSGNVTNCYNKGNITSLNHFIGGVVGWNKGYVANCYNVGHITAATSLIGGVAGGNSGSSIVRNCYSLVDCITNGELDITRATSFTDASYYSSSYLKSSGFILKLNGENETDVWCVDHIGAQVNGGYPIFLWQ